MLGQGAPNLPSCLLQTRHFAKQLLPALVVCLVPGSGNQRGALRPSLPVRQGGDQGAGAGAGAARGCSILRGRERFFSWTLAPRVVSDAQPFMRPCTPFPSHGTFMPGIVPASFCPMSSRGVRGMLQLSSSDNNPSLQQTTRGRAFPCLQVEPGCRGREGWPEHRLRGAMQKDRRRIQTAPAQAMCWDAGTPLLEHGAAGTARGWRSRLLQQQVRRQGWPSPCRVSSLLPKRCRGGLPLGFPVTRGHRLGDPFSGSRDAAATAATQGRVCARGQR